MITQTANRFVLIHQDKKSIPSGTVFTTTVGQLLSKNYAIRRKVRNNYPHCCVYIIHGNDGEVLYIGATNYHVSDRIRQHTYTKSILGKAIHRHFPQSHEWKVKMIKMPDRETALQEERQYIKKLKPIYNRS